MATASVESIAHPLVVKELSCLRVESCTGKKLFKCPLCTPDKFRPSFKSAVERHIERFHWNHKVEIAGEPHAVYAD